MVDQKEKFFFDRDEVTYFFEAPGFSLPSLLVNTSLSLISRGDKSH